MHGKIHECFLSNSSILTIGNWSVPRKYCPIICCPVLAAIYAHYHIMYMVNVWTVTVTVPKSNMLLLDFTNHEIVKTYLFIVYFIQLMQVSI